MSPDAQEMDGTALRNLLEGVRRGELPVDTALAQVTQLTQRAHSTQPIRANQPIRTTPLPTTPLPTGDELPSGPDSGEPTGNGIVGDFARVDHDRTKRCGHPEVVFCQGKEPEQAAAIAAEILRHSPRVLLTRADPAHADAVRERFRDASHHQRARCITVDPTPVRQLGLVAVAAAGTADIPVAEEARITLETFGSVVETFYDIGVAGLHRLQTHLPAIRRAQAIVVVAGMDGALPSVLGGLVSVPVIAVPTNVGYGASFEGLAALLAMLNACAAGVGVVNIDNGFGAGYLAGLINQQTANA